MRRHSWSTRILFGLLALCLAGPALGASDLDAAKTAGQVGERADGYVGLVQSGAPAQVKQLVESVNSGRRKSYSQIAAKNGIAVESVAARAGARLVGGAASGEWVMKGGGGWKRVP
jgi:uncharacterized protein YdbL (DUF1318 family)